MNDTPRTPTSGARELRSYPKVTYDGEGQMKALHDDDFSLTKLTGMRTEEAAKGVFTSALTALGKVCEKQCPLASAMFAELEPRDAIEAMLVAQMTATHLAVTTLSEKTSYQTQSDIRESCERSMTRLSRTFIAQMDAFKKYRAKAQQTVRVERVTVNEGGQAIVGDVSHRGEG